MFQPGLHTVHALRELATGRRETHCRGVDGTGFRDSISKVRQAGGAVASRKNRDPRHHDPCLISGECPFVLNFNPQRIGILFPLDGI